MDRKFNLEDVLINYNNLLASGIKNARNVTRYLAGAGSICELDEVLSQRRAHDSGTILFLLDEFFDERWLASKVRVASSDIIINIDTSDEPTVQSIDALVAKIRAITTEIPAAIVGIGGGCTLDSAKAISNLLTNGGSAADYQGWDLLTKPGVFKIGVPTISGTGAEATRTCVLTNKRTGLKLGMNSDFTVFDQIVLDPNLMKSVPRDQFFYTGMDAYIHSFEALEGNYRNFIGDSFSQQAMQLCREVFLADDMMGSKECELLMSASYLGGCAIATSYVGLVHPLSAALSVNYGVHHCLANCIAMRAVEEFYPIQYAEFWMMVEKQGIFIPKGICIDAIENDFNQLRNSVLMHQKPLVNALGEKYEAILNSDKVFELFSMM